MKIQDKKQAFMEKNNNFHKPKLFYNPTNLIVALT